MENPTPLRGLTFLNTREQRSAPQLTGPLVEFGAQVVECPTIALSPPPSWVPFDERLERLTVDDWIVFTSANAVRATMQRLWDLNRPLGALKTARIACIGRGTEAALINEGLEAELVPPNSQQEPLLAAMLARLTHQDKVWIPRAKEAREHLVEGIQKAGIKVDVTPVYTTVHPKEGLQPAREKLLANKIDWIVFTSTSTVRHFMELLDPQLRAHLRNHWPQVACIGAVSAQAAKREGIEVHVVPKRQDVEGLVWALVDYIAGGLPAGEE